MRDHYKVLGVSRNATPEEIKRSYRRLVGEFHPDRNHGSENAVEMSKMINEAYEVLSDIQKRSELDQLLGEGNIGDEENIAFRPATSGNAPSGHSLILRAWEWCTDSKPAVMAAILLSDVVIGIFLFLYLQVVQQAPVDDVQRIVRSAYYHVPGFGGWAVYDTLKGAWPNNYRGIGILFLMFSIFVAKILSKERSNPIWMAYLGAKLFLLYFLSNVIREVSAINGPAGFLGAFSKIGYAGMLLFVVSLFRSRRRVVGT